jgi:sortase A
MGGTIEAGRARGLARVLAALMAAAALIPLASGGYILAKAQVAQWLLTSALDRTLAGETQVRPWHWADTWPVARLDLGPKGGSVLVLAGASPRTLAFGPGHLGSTPLPGAGGNSAFAGHRDTHFAALADLAPGDGLRVEIPGRTLGYRVTETRVVDQAEVGVLADRGGEGLTLITCYPFDALLPGGPLRFVVFAASR